MKSNRLKVKVMEYQIVVTKREENPNYKELQCDGTAYRDDRNENEREFYIDHKVLTTVVSESEFAAIKKACLEVM